MGSTGSKVKIFSVSKAVWCSGEVVKVSASQSPRQWEIGCPCKVYSQSQDKWIDGKVLKVSKDKEENEWIEAQYGGFTKRVRGDNRDVIKFMEEDAKGAWLTVVYDNTTKVISRFHKNIRPIGDGKDEASKEKALEYLANHLLEEKKPSIPQQNANEPLMLSPSVIRSPMAYEENKVSPVHGVDTSIDQNAIQNMMLYNQQLFQMSQSAQANTMPLSPSAAAMPNGQYNGSNNVYVKNLHERVNDDGLRAMFKTFGKIISAKVKYDKLGQSRCFGFVLFETAECAQLAISAMANSIQDGKVLYVSIAQPRAFRKTFLKQQMYGNANASGTESICWDYNTMRGCEKTACKWEHEYIDGTTVHPISGELIDGNAVRALKETKDIKKETLK